MLYRLAQLEKLEGLTLDKNPLKVVPSAIYSIGSLQTLCLNECELTNVDDRYKMISAVFAFSCTTAKYKLIHAQSACCALETLQCDLTSSVIE